MRGYNGDEMVPVRTPDGRQVSRYFLTKANPPGLVLGLFRTATLWSASAWVENYGVVTGWGRDRRQARRSLIRALKAFRKI